MKSFVDPYVYSRQNDLWIMRDGVGIKPRRIPRKSEIVVSNLSASEVIERVRAENLGWHFISHLHTPDVDPDAIRSEYKSNGYRSLLSEGFFVHDSAAVFEFACEPPVRRVNTKVDSGLIRKERRNKKAIRDNDLDADTPEHRLYSVIDGDKALGWVGSVPFGRLSWIADLFVLPDHRGRGYGSALMCEVTRDDRRHGVETSVLLASAAGARLYPHVGYTQIGSLQLFCPKR